MWLSLSRKRGGDERERGREVRDNVEKICGEEERAARKSNLGIGLVAIKIREKIENALLVFVLIAGFKTGRI